MKKTIWLCLVLMVAIPFMLSAQQKQVRLAYRTTHEISASFVLQKSNLNYRFNAGYVFPLITKMHGYGSINRPTYFAMRDLHRTGFTYGFMLEAPFKKNERWSKAILLEGSYLTGNFFDNNYLSGMSSVTETAKKFHEYRNSVGVHARLSKQVSEKGYFLPIFRNGSKTLACCT